MIYPSVQPPQGELRLGATLLWCGSGTLFHILSFLIGLKDPMWRALSLEFTTNDGIKFRGKPWHMSQIVGWDEAAGWIVDEAAGNGDRRIPLRELSGGYIVVNWVTNPADVWDCQQFIKEFSDCQYDKLAYLWTALDKLFGFPRLMNQKQTCWERNADFCQWLHEPWCEYYDWPWLPDFIRVWLARYNTADMLRYNIKADIKIKQQENTHG